MTLQTFDPTSEVDHQIPDSWTWTTLGETCFLNMGQSPPSSTYNDQNEGLPFFQGKAEFGDLYPSVVKWCSEPIKVVEPEDILISVRAPVGPTNLARERSCIGRGLAGIRPHLGMPPRYFLYYLRYVESYLADEGTGSTFDSITKSILTHWPVPLAPVSEQRRIVEEIETQFTRLDKGVEALERVRASLQRYKASVLKAACEGRLVPQDPDDEPASELLERILAERRARWEDEYLAKQVAKGKTPKNDKWKDKYKEPEKPDTDVLPTLSDGWIWVSMDQLTVGIRSGTPDVPQDTETDFPVLRSSSVRPFTIDYDDVRYLPESSGFEGFLKQGCVLFTRLSGSLEYVGNAAQVKHEKAITISYPDRLIRVTPVTLEIGAYIELWFNSPLMRDHIRDVAKSSAGHQRITQVDIMSPPVALPPKKELEQVISQVHRLLSVIQDTENMVTIQLRRAERMRQSILKKAFEGALVRQDPDDESAYELLERIRQERESRE